MASRKSHASSPDSLQSKKSTSSSSSRSGKGPALARATAADVPSASSVGQLVPSDVPATCGLLYAVRLELLERIDQSQVVLRNEVHQTKDQLRLEIRGVQGEVATHRLETRQMKEELRTETRQMKEELRGEMHQIKEELRGEMHQIKGELRTEVGELRAEVHQMKGEITEVKVGLYGVQSDVQALQADMHGLKVNMARMVVLMEEQNARNKIVLDALGLLRDRQDRQEQRVDAVETTVRDLASARRP